MIKTSKNLCYGCQYSSSSADGPVCFYYVDTKEHRNCPVGYCDKYVKADLQAKRAAEKERLRDMMTIQRWKAKQKKNNPEVGWTSVDHGNWDIKRKKYE